MPFPSRAGDGPHLGPGTISHQSHTQSLALQVLQDLLDLQAHSVFCFSLTRLVMGRGALPGALLGALPGSVQFRFNSD